MANASADRQVCPHCGRIFLLKPAGQRAHMAYPFHNIARRGNQSEPLPTRCRGSGLVVRVMTDAEADEMDAMVEAEVEELFAQKNFDEC